MRKLLFVAMAFVAMAFVAQGQSKFDFKSLMKDVKVDAFIGMGTAEASSPFNEGMITSTFGINLRKPLHTLIENKLDLYAFSGLHFNTKGGIIDPEKQRSAKGGRLHSTDERLATIRQGGGNDFSSSTLAIPAYLGAKYHLLDYLSVFAEGGAYLAFTYGGYDYKGGMNRYPVELGVGYNMGVEFKRVSLRAGLDYSLSPTAKLKTNEFDQHLPKASNSLRNLSSYLSIGWRLHGKRK